MLACVCDSHMGLAAHLMVIPEPSWEYSVFGEADILVLLHLLVHAVHAQVLQVHPCCQALQPDPNQTMQTTSTMTRIKLIFTLHEIDTWQQMFSVIRTTAYLASVKNRPVSCASAEIAIEGLLNLCC